MKLKLIFLQCVLLSLTSFAQTLPSGYPADGIVGYWSLSGNANDTSNNANNGTVNGATPTTNRFGIANEAYEFNGTSDFIEIADSNSLDLSTNRFTLSGWFSSNIAGSASQSVLGKG